MKQSFQRKHTPAHDYQSYWESTFKPLFDPAGMNFQVDVRNGERVRYTNLDHAATTMPFREVKEFVNEWFKHAMLFENGTIGGRSVKRALVGMVDQPRLPFSN